MVGEEEGGEGGKGRRGEEEEGKRGGERRAEPAEEKGTVLTRPGEPSLKAFFHQ